MKNIAKNIKERLRNTPFILNNYILFYATPKFAKAESEKIKSKFYTSDSPRATNEQVQVIFMADGRRPHGGLTDRLRGLLSTYSVCKQCGYDFRINFVSPFQLSDYLQPHTFDWRIAPEEICYNNQDATVETFLAHGEVLNSSYTYWRTKRRIRKDAKKFKQIHVYSNASMSEREQKARACELFNELFTPIPALQAKLDENARAIGGKYCSASFRFQQMLGDFKDDKGGHWKTLDSADQQKLMDTCLQQLKAVREREQIDKMLLASDSIRFLEFAQEWLDFVYVVPGQMMHIEANEPIPFEVNLKTFVDMLMISRAEKAFLFQTGDMYSSNFPRFASELGGIPFEVIHF